MNYEDQKCIHCGSENVFKRPALSIYEKKIRVSQKTGDVVNQYIEDVKREIKEEKKELRKEEM